MKKFTDKELDYLSRGMIALIRDACEAKKLVMDRGSQVAIDFYIEELKSLNTKICTMNE